MKTLVTMAVILMVTLTSCSKFLDLKPDSSIKNPETLDDLSALLNNQSRTSMGNYSGLVESGSDDFILDPSVYQTRATYFQDLYRWDVDPISANDGVGHSWTSLYETVLYANIVLEYLDKLSGGDQAFRDRIRGDALFLRSYRFFQLLQTFSPPYLLGDEDNPLGIPLRLSSNIKDITKRSTVKASYQQVIDDLTLAGTLLPVHVNAITRPNRASAFGLLARVYHSIGDYDNALLYAEKCLDFKNTLLDFNIIDVNSPFPFSTTNPEIIYHSASGAASQLLASSRIDVSQDLYSKYAENDLRKMAFFRIKGPGRIAFKGSYSGEITSYYSGISVNEMVLIAAECQIRLKNIQNGLSKLNYLLLNRYNKGDFQPITSTDGHEALSIVLSERRKELAFRGTRWSDLRRLNRDPRFVKTVIRSFPNEDGNIQSVELKPNDNRYTYKIPQKVIDQTGMNQNP